MLLIIIVPRFFLGIHVLARSPPITGDTAVLYYYRSHQGTHILMIAQRPHRGSEFTGLNIKSTNSMARGRLHDRHRLGMNFHIPYLSSAAMHDGDFLASTVRPLAEGPQKLGSTVGPRRTHTFYYYNLTRAVGAIARVVFSPDGWRRQRCPM
jgi:hypothetical protein